MSELLASLNEIKKQKPTGYWSDRILAELEYVARLSNIKKNQHDKIIGAVIKTLNENLAEEGVISKSACLDAEKQLAKLSKEAKSFSMICAAHAHIDMNWMWSWDETVSITIDTFRTMLNLMEEYPEFKFSQSQASVYHIIEEYAPDMLPEIKKYIKEGRWEVTASHWVEADKNMPSGESFARHLLYTKRYLSELLDIKPETLNIDFEPDTFGHTLNVPEILAEGGVKYYYHCRGYEEHHLYRWVAPSGSAVTVYREPIWYNATIEPVMTAQVPEFCSKNGLTTMLKVYGVGDHGGGPTRRDIERIKDMNSWPIFPNIRFGTFAEFYALVEPIAHKLPEVKGELNFVFSGCYTSQSRIKMANRIGEATLNEAETWSAISSVAAKSKYPALSYEKAWRNILLNQFHDILPGSGVQETREHAMGLFQNAMASANANRSQALRDIAAMIDTSKYMTDEDIKTSISEGAGVGFGIKDFKIAQIERGKGKHRVFNFFNSSAYDREEVVEIIAWDWQGEPKSILISDDQGKAVKHQLIGNGFNGYWGHHYARLLVMVKVPAFGYSSYFLTEAKGGIDLYRQKDQRVDKEIRDQFSLENEKLKVIFHPVNGSILSLVDKKTGDELVDTKQATGIFRLIHEDTNKWMTAWWVGRYMRVENLHEKNVVIKKVYDESSPLRQAISYEMSFERSKLKVIVSLDKNSSVLDFNVECDWHELGKQGDQLPQLNFFMPLGYTSESYKYDVAFGTIDRAPLMMDVPANSWGLALRKNPKKKSIKITTRTKYGFRGIDNSIALTLLRSSCDPDPYPEIGLHKFQFAVSVVGPTDNKTHIEDAYNYCHPMQVISSAPQKGKLPTNHSFAKILEGNVAISAIKVPETSSNHQWIIRFYETEGSTTKATIQFAKAPIKVHWADLHETPIQGHGKITIKGHNLTFAVEPNKIVSLCVEF